MASPVVHWEIGGRGRDGLSTFYRELFGWEPASFDADYCRAARDWFTSHLTPDPNRWAEQ